ncbi:vacuolar protein sorting-associated protein VTA1 [Kwoniella heveanensis CBS 569]|nr:vacuolar protein sorting-associated protein VTA1 [Kwoniella heveanensis CBS 569]
MESVNIPTENIPQGLKPCEQILKRAKEIKNIQPVVAYWCCFSAAQKALNIKQRTKEETLFLMQLIDALEAMKAALSNNEAITSEAAGAALVEAFALKVFMTADNADRAGNTGKATIRNFVVAGQFIEVLKCFENGMTDEMEQKLQYARWKAADGAKALREGRTPASGPPIPEGGSDENPFPTLPTELPSSPPAVAGQGRGSFSSSTRPGVPGSDGSTPIASPRPSPGGGARPALPGIRTSQDDLRTPSRTQSGGSGAWSTVATPGLPDDETEPHFDLNKPSVVLPSAPPMTPPEKGSPGEKKNVRFMGPDGAPLSPASTHITVSSYDAPPPPPPTDFDSPPVSPKPSPNVVLAPPPTDRPRGDSSASSSSRSGGNGNGNGNVPAHAHGSPKHLHGTNGDRSRSDGHGGASPSAIPRNNANRPSTNASSSITVPPPPPPSLASYPMHPPAQPQPYGLGLTSPPPPPSHSHPSTSSSGSGGGSGYTSAPAPGPTRTNLTRREVEQTQKHAKWAISALEFDDFETARNELKKALNMLGG